MNTKGEMKKTTIVARKEEWDLFETLAKIKYEKSPLSMAIDEAMRLFIEKNIDLFDEMKKTAKKYRTE